MRDLSQITAILSGYGALSLGVLKVLWICFGVHFYESEISHAPQAPIGLDLLLIAGLAVGGTLLVVLDRVIVSLIVVLTICLFEAAFLHDGIHHFWQLSVLIFVTTGFVTTLYINLLWIALSDTTPNR